MTAADVDELRAVGLGDASILHVVVQSAFFNYLNRVADAVGIDFDYESRLPPMVKDVTREPLARPPAVSAAPVSSLRMADRPATDEALRRWRAYLLDRDGPLSRRDRHVIAAAVAGALSDATMSPASPAGRREQALAAYADTLTSAPWRLTAESLVPLRAEGLDDRALLDVIAVAAHQNAASRISRVVVT